MVAPNSHSSGSPRQDTSAELSDDDLLAATGGVEVNIVRNNTTTINETVNEEVMTNQEFLYQTSMPEKVEILKAIDNNK